jgi:hypothetical protein
MRTLIAILLTSFLVVGSAIAAPFNPKPGEVCTPSPTPSAGRSKVDPRKLLGVLLKSQKIFDVDLDTSGNATSFDTRMDAVLRSDAFCDPIGRCSEGTAAKLATATFALVDFLTRNSRAVPTGQSGFEVRPPVGNELDQARMSAFLRGAGGSYQIACIASVAALPAAPSEATVQATKFISAIAVRRNIEDLSIPSSSAKFDGLDRAGISYTDDRVKGTRTLATAGVAGYQLPDSLFGEYARTILFADYYGNRVWADNTKNSQNIGNAGAGILGSFDIPVGGFFHNVDLFGHYVHSHVTDSDLVSGKLVITPDLPIPGVGIAFNPNDGPLAFLLKPQLNFVYGSVLNAGSNPSLADTSEYARGGGKIAFWIFGVDGIFKNFTLSSSYESAKVWKGPFDSISRFESALGYMLGDQNNWAIELKYANGRNLDTLEREQVVMLGLGFKQ